MLPLCIIPKDLNKNIALTETVIYGPFTDYSLQQVVR